MALIHSTGCVFFFLFSDFISNRSLNSIPVWAQGDMFKSFSITLISWKLVSRFHYLPAIFDILNVFAAFDILVTRKMLTFKLF